ncbi:alpha/beta hydrolase [uncultured Shewanella sp.]|uniref:alpha/beta fold hydrolase n=1 Tax=uncultured Shewanella sp. TaxID=173975 RepID=UPI0026102D76|nr:alpha/beta hydrolase [uncultured Shewanella sp.]
MKALNFTCSRIFALSLVLLCASVTAGTKPLWQTLPPTPKLPNPTASGYAKVNGAEIWYAEFGKGKPVILLHGGLANANYFGDLVPVLDKKYRVIVMDTRGHGRSSNDGQQLTYKLLSSDVVGLMDHLKIFKAAVIGWSDGAIVGLDMAMQYPKRLTRVFAFAANSNPSGVKDTSKSPVFQTFSARTKKEYQALSPTPNGYVKFSKNVTTMWATHPDFTKQELAKIHTPVWIVDGDHDEAIKRSDTEFLANSIPGARLVIQKNVSHFSFLQNPKQFDYDVLAFLKAESPEND